MASPGQPLVTVEDDRSFRLEVRLDVSRAAFVHLGDEVRVRIDGAAPDATGRVPRWNAWSTPARTISS